MKIIARQLILRSAIVVLVCMALFSARHLHAADSAAMPSIPNGALAFLHIDAQELCRSPSFAFLTQLSGHITTEASDYSLTKLGIDVTTLAEVTVVILPADQFTEVSTRNFPGVIVATFADGFRTEVLLAALQTGLKLTSAENGTYTSRNRDFALFVATDRTLVAGTRSSISWWLDARKQSANSKLLHAFSESLGRRSIVAGCDLSQARQIVAMLPPVLQKVFKAGVVTAAVDIGDKLGVEMIFRYANEADASASVREFEQLIAQCKHFLTRAEFAVQQPLNNPAASIADGFSALAALAGLRQAQAYLSDVVVEQRASSIRLAAEIDNEITSTVMICLTAINAVGGHKEQKAQRSAPWRP